MAHALRNYITKDVSTTNLQIKFNCFNISDLHDVENNPLVGMLAILTCNESVFQPYQFAETMICWIYGLSLYYSIILHVLTSAIYEISLHL